jgi:hypothetical protein
MNLTCVSDGAELLLYACYGVHAEMHVCFCLPSLSPFSLVRRPAVTALDGQYRLTARVPRTHESCML